MSNDSEQAYQEVYNFVNGIYITGIICAPIVFALLAVVVCAFRAYKTTFQRLILYHIVITLYVSVPLLFESKCTLIQGGSVSLPYTFICTASSLGMYTQLLWLTTCFCSPSDCQEEIQKSGSMVNLPNASVLDYHSHYLWHMHVWIPLRDGALEAHYYDKLSSAKWDKDTIIFNITVLVLFLEVLVISIILCCLFCYLYAGCTKLEDSSLSCLIST